MEIKIIRLTQQVTKDLKLKDGEGYSLSYVRKVLSNNDERKNEDVELIARTIKQSVKKTTECLLLNFEGVKAGNQFLIPVGKPKKKKKKRLSLK